MKKCVIVGGGVAGVSCARSLASARGFRDRAEIILITAGRHVKTVHNWIKLGQFTELFDVREEGLSFAGDDVRVISAAVTAWSYEARELRLSNGATQQFDSLVIATGARPKNPYADKSRVLTIRDTDTAQTLEHKLAGARTVAVIGNGGIATEVVFELRNVDIVWCIKDEHISSAYFDKEAAEFVEARAREGRTGKGKHEIPVPRVVYTDTGSKASSSVPGCALGPDWSTVVHLNGNAEGHSLRVLRNVEVEDLQESADSVIITLTNNDQIKVDIVIWATGVIPNSELWSTDYPALAIANDNGLLVDESMQTSLQHVFACGDVCTVNWPQNPFWTQMRTWTQARQMGAYTARRLTGEADSLDFCFEMFAHCTTFYGYKVVLLGDFKGCKHATDVYVNERVVENGHLVRCVMKEHRIIGAILIGDTDLEEVLENLILNGTDIRSIEYDFLDPSIDLEDYFD